MLRPTLVLTSLFFALLGCDPQVDQEPPPQTEPDPSTKLSDIDPDQAASSRLVWQLGDTLLTETGAECAAMHLSLEQFLAQPQAESLARARTDWHSCHNQWHQFDLFTRLNDINPGLFGGLAKLSFAIEAYPLQPGYLDSLEAYPYSGIVNDISLSITADNLRTQHGLTDSEDVSLGLHALEFLLWGETGERPAGDYDAEQVDADPDSQLKPAEQPISRRRELLLLVSHLLQDDLERLQHAWQPGQGGLGDTYEQLHPASRVQLLKSAGHHLLSQHLPNQLRQLTEPETQHNRFAGQSLTPVVSAIKGLDRVYFTGEPALAQWLGETDSIKAWRNQLEELSARLEAEAETETQAPSEPDALAEAIRDLARPLAAPTSLEVPPVPKPEEH